MRSELLEEIAARIVDHPHRPVVRVGIDGVDGAGKTTLADEFAVVLRSTGRQIIRASVDSFHHPRARRYARGRFSPEGYYLDSFDLDTLRSWLLDPLSPGGDGRFRTAAFDHRRDARVDAPVDVASSDAILIFDGVFLHRPELASYWDLSLFLQVSPAESLRRCLAREGGAGSADPRHASNRRYVEGQSMYLRAREPAKRATLVVNNEDPEQASLGR